jgi:hypothetical protein
MTMYLVLSAFNSRPIYLLANQSFRVFSLFCTLPSNILSSSAWTKSWCVTFNIKSYWFTWTFLIAYSKAMLKSNGDKTSPYFERFLTVNVYDKCLPTRTWYRFHSDTYASTLSILALAVLWDTKLNENIIIDSHFFKVWHTRCVSKVRNKSI